MNEIELDDFEIFIHYSKKTNWIMKASSDSHSSPIYVPKSDGIACKLAQTIVINKQKHLICLQLWKFLMLLIIIDFVFIDLGRSLTFYSSTKESRGQAFSRRRKRSTKSCLKITLNVIRMNFFKCLLRQKLEQNNDWLR